MNPPNDILLHEFFFRYVYFLEVLKSCCLLLDKFCLRYYLVIIWTLVSHCCLITTFSKLWIICLEVCCVIGFHYWYIIIAQNIFSLFNVTGLH